MPIAPSSRRPTPPPLPWVPKQNPNCRGPLLPHAVAELALLQPLAPHRLAHRVLHVPDGGPRPRPQPPAAPPAAQPEAVQRRGGDGAGGRVPQGRGGGRAREGAEGRDDHSQDGAEGYCDCMRCVCQLRILFRLILSGHMG